MTLDQAGADQVVRHPIRIRIVTLAATREKLTPKEVADALGCSLGVVAYHIRLMDDLGVLERMGTEVKRGGTVHLYRLDRQATRFIREALDKMLNDGLAAKNALPRR
jgi:predicted transcriptional regulator